MCANGFAVLTFGSFSAFTIHSIDETRFNQHLLTAQTLLWNA
jgi:hypothetical protein